MSERQRTRGGEAMFVSLAGYAVDIRPLRVHVPVFPDSYLPGVYSSTESDCIPIKRLYTYKGSGADALQRPLRYRFRARLTAGVGAPSEAWRFLQGASPCGVRPNQPLLPSVASVKEVQAERHR